MSKVTLKNRTLRVNIDDDIFDSWWAVSSRDIRDGIEYYEGQYDRVEVRINSLGGSVNEGMAIRNALLEVGKAGIPVEPKITGVAASIASIIALSGTKKPEIDTGVYLMIHRVWTFTSGDFEDLENTANTMRKMNDDLVTIYEENSNLNRDEIKDFMKKETWFTAEEALKFNFAEKAEMPAEPVMVNYGSSDPEKKSQILDHFKNVPENILNSRKPNVNQAHLELEAKGDVMAGELKKLLKDNPEAKAEHDELLAQAAKGAGDSATGKDPEVPANSAGKEGDGGGNGDDAKAQADKSAEAVKTRAKNVATSDTYPKTIKDSAVAFLSGETESVVFEASVAAYDATIEAQNSGNSQEDTEEQGETPPNGGGTKNKNNDDEFLASDEASVMALVGANGGVQ
jgi:ATP-dependent Clp protease protease subunit